ncbi:MAG: TonB-dependent receptor plug domain-containing protein [Bacteroidota bacterium]|nr:TonB-dependent receptor plug domain-containing protein [Bacteroidota bacterium]
MKRKSLLFLLGYFAIFSLRAQDIEQNFLDSIAGRLITEVRKNGRPQALLETDKTIFKAGESIWFRSFLVNSISHKVTRQSKYLFVDIVNDKDSVVSSVLLDGSRQQLNSKIALPATISPGYYWIRAYTRQMAEGDSNNAVVKPLYVVDVNGSFTTKNLAVPKALPDKEPVVQFYPEGGNLITGANSTVAVVIEDARGNAIATEVVIKDSRDTIVARFTSSNIGIGKFSFTPSYLRKYKASLNWNGIQLSYPLPPFNFFAGQIAILKQPGGSKTLRVLLEDSLYKKNVVTYLIGISKDSLCFAAIGRGQYEIPIPVQKFPEGVATFYLLDSRGKLLSERSIYINEHNLLVTPTLTKNTFSKREKVVLNISVTDANHQPVPALLSVAVADSAFSGGEEITNRLHILEQVRTTPNIFGNMNDEDADLLMLLISSIYTKTPSYNTNHPDAADDSLLFIKGKAIDEKGRPAANTILSLISNDGKATFLIDTTDNAGKFLFPVHDYSDSTEFAIHARNMNSTTENVRIERELLAFPGFRTPVTLKSYFSYNPVLSAKNKKAYLDTSLIYAGTDVLNSVTVRGKKKKDYSYNEALRVSPTSVIIAGNQLDERRSVGDIVQNASGVRLLNRFLVIGGLTSLKAPDASSEPLLLIDGVQAPGITGVDESPVIAVLNSINAKDIDFIEILKGPEGSNYGMRGGNGVILVNMASNRRDNFKRNTIDLQTFFSKGISKPSPFPLINYDIKETKAIPKIDNRSTIYWNGSVLTGTQEPVSLTFFTSDISTTYKVTITGVTVYGDKIYKTMTFYNK